MNSLTLEGINLSAIGAPALMGIVTRMFWIFDLVSKESGTLLGAMPTWDRHDRKNR